jgi:membrane-bound lytic murein transglycosylase D
LNPSFNRLIVAGGASCCCRENVDRFTPISQPDATTAAASWTVYQMKPADTLAAVARRVGINEEQLREANRIPPRYLIRAGSTILIPRDETMDSDIPADSLDARFALVPEHSNLRKITYRVRRATAPLGRAPLERLDQGHHRLEQLDQPGSLRWPAPRADRG